MVVTMHSVSRRRRLTYYLSVTLLVFAISVVAAWRPVYAATEPVARWKFDETVAGTDAADYIGTNHGMAGPGEGNYPIPSTDVAPVNFENPRSASFDGSQYYTINNPVSTDFSVCAWVKTTSSGGGTNHWESAPIIDAEWGGVNFDFGFGIGNGGRLMFGNGGTPVGGGGLFDTQVNGTTAVNDNQWHNVCMTRNNADGVVKLYVDAQLDGNGTSGVGELNVRSVARIGWGYDGAALFEGLIDDVRVYNVVLDEAQLQNLTDGSEDPDGDPALPLPDEDRNGDGIKDSEQGNVALIATVNNKEVALEFDEVCDVNSAQYKAEATNTVQDPGYDYPEGLLYFMVECGEDGFTTTVKQYYYDVTPDGFVARKYNPNTNAYFTISGGTITQQVIHGQNVTVLTYQIKDGGLLDIDGEENGIIIDPAGLGQAAVGVPNTGLGDIRRAQ